MIDLATDIGLGILGLAMLAATIRIILGPTLADRILGLDTITLVSIGIIALFAVKSGLYLYTDIAISLSLLSFLSTAAFARYLLSRLQP
jgi:multicomponent Na+:H+ antiporter subunit F